MYSRQKQINSPFDPGQMEAYEDSLKVYRDLKGVIDTSHDEGYDEGYGNGHGNGLKEGREKEKIDMARLMKQEGEPIEKIVRYTGLTPADIESI
jgi:flagellar biosynthesis/type III secretory pathway protein FliH